MRYKQPRVLVFTAGTLIVATAAFGFHQHVVPVLADRAARTTYLNPVIDRNFPDPSLLKDSKTYYAYATNFGENMPCARSSDLVHWAALPDAMPHLPGWAKPDRTWAPEVRALVPGKRYLAYFTAWDRSTNEEAIGAATSSTPSGPFTSPLAAKPLVEQAEEGGAIDPSSFVDTDGKRYLVWKNDGNSRGQDTWLWLQRLDQDGIRLTGAPVKLIKEDQAWEGSLVEAPTLWKHSGKYYLFYSANFYGNCSYAIGYAVADSVQGPYVKPHRSAPLLASTTGVCGPGGEDIVTASDGTDWMAYHTWAKGPNSYRSMSLAPLRWQGAVPVVRGSFHTRQAAPK